MYRSGLSGGETVKPETSVAGIGRPARANSLKIQRLGKRSMDIAGALVALVTFFWLFVFLWAAVRVTTGSPVIYRHKRVGVGGRGFDCLKFRSMVRDSDRRLADFLNSSPAAREEWSRNFKLTNDPRITPFGRFIRKTSLDELPQFWNVLVGDMSLVGPRPVTAEELQKYYGPAAAQYVSMRPGLTGLWQVGARHQDGYAARVALDVDYIESWSLARDVAILLKTVVVVLTGRGAQ
jgi:undecaprenyl-phosphate galactose phosphotransferase